jgi:hypothetical protein
MRLFLMTVLCWAMLLSAAAGQTDSRWLIVPSSSTADTDWIEPTVARVRAALVDQGAELWPIEQAATEFEEEASAPATALSKRDLEGWMSLSGDAVHDLADGNYKRALERLNAAQKLSRKAIEELNREPERAARVFDTCLYIVRAVLATESESRARAMARECRQLVPRAEPSPYMHPPPVTDLLGQIDALQAKQTGTLRVDSSPSGCPARLNGVLLGETPVSMRDLFPGEYRVQVECDPSRRGRVHFVTVGAAQTERHVDSRFDGSVESRPTLRLSYRKPADEREHRVADARTIGSELSAKSIVLVSRPTPVTIELELIELDESKSVRPLALARIPTAPHGAGDSDLALAATALVDGRCVDFSSGDPVSLPCASDEPVGAESTAAPAGSAEGRRPRGQFVAGLTLVGVGVAGLATGYALLIPRKNAALDWVNEVDSGGQDTSAQQKWFDLRGGIIGSASVGAGALVAAMPLALPERQKTPWWAWVSGGVGLGLAGFSIAWGVTAEAEPPTSCSTHALSSTEVRSCVNRGKQTTVALLTGLTAAPLITMPLVYLFRPNRAKLEPQVEVGRSGAHFGIRGRF